MKTETYNHTNLWMDRIKTVLFMIALVAITALCFFLYKGYQSREVIAFAMQNPDLVLNMKERIASESAQVKLKIMTQEKTAQDKLIEAVASEVEASKP